MNINVQEASTELQAESDAQPRGARRGLLEDFNRASQDQDEEVYSSQNVPTSGMANMSLVPPTAPSSSQVHREQLIGQLLELYYTAKSLLKPGEVLEPIKTVEMTIKEIEEAKQGLTVWVDQRQGRPATLTDQQRRWIPRIGPVEQQQQQLISDTNALAADIRAQRQQLATLLNFTTPSRDVDMLPTSQQNASASPHIAASPMQSPVQMQQPVIVHGNTTTTPSMPTPIAPPVAATQTSNDVISNLEAENQALTQLHDHLTHLVREYYRTILIHEEEVQAKEKKRRQAKEPDNSPISPVQLAKAEDNWKNAMIRRKSRLEEQYVEYLVRKEAFDLAEPIALAQAYTAAPSPPSSMRDSNSNNGSQPSPMSTSEAPTAAVAVYPLSPEQIERRETQRRAALARKKKRLAEGPFTKDFFRACEKAVREEVWEIQKRREERNKRKRSY